MNKSIGQSQAASVRRVLGRSAVAVVVALSTVCVTAPASQAVIPGSLSIAWQGTNGHLFYWNALIEGVNDTGQQMMAGTSPSINNWSDMAFQTNHGTLEVSNTAVDGPGDFHLGMMQGTSPSMDDNDQAVFQADTGDLWAVGGTSCNCSWHLGMMAGSNPSIAHQTGNAGSQDNHIAFQANTGILWNLFAATPYTGLAIDPGTSPSINEVGQVAFARSGSLWTYDPAQGELGAKDLGTGMAPGTSPSINAYGNVAFQANTGKLYITGHGDTGQAMAPRTSPSMDQWGNVAYQGSDGQLWLWTGTSATNFDFRHQKLAAGTSPSIEPGVTLRCCGQTSPRPTSVVGGSPNNDQLGGDSGNDLIRGGRGNDVIRGAVGDDRSYGGPGKDRVYGGPGNDRLYGGPGNDRLYGGPGTDLIVDHSGATTVSPGSGANVVDVKDGRGDDRVVCTRGTINDWFADRRDRIARSCYDPVKSRKMRR
jgi:Ca2+-binding RTX toxin-like protein